MERLSEGGFVRITQDPAGFSTAAPGWLASVAIASSSLGDLRVLLPTPPPLLTLERSEH